MITLRDNQVEPVRIGIEFFQQKREPSIITAPTAFGKSLLIAKIAESITDKVIVLQPSKELLEQNYGKFIGLGGRAAIYSASFGKKQIDNVTYATIGSIKSKGITFRAFGFNKMIIDECDRYPREMMESMIGRFLRESGISHVLGLTATPLKLQQNFDMQGNTFSKLQMLTSRSKNGNFFKEIIYVSQIEEMVRLGYWAQLEYEQYDMDLTGLRYNSTKADYTEESLNEVYRSNNLTAKICHKIDELKDRKSIIVFVPSVQDAKDLSLLIPNSTAVYGDMDKKERDRAVTAFKNGSLRVVINVNVLSVGFDSPNVDAIICSRPTASLAWFYQALGRGTRIHPDKKDCLIVDFSGNVAKFGKVEGLKYVKEGQIWKLYNGEGVLLSGVPLHQIGMHHESTQGAVMPFGKFKGVPLIRIDKSYRSWCIQNCTFYNPKIKEELMALQKQGI